MRNFMQKSQCRLLYSLYLFLAMAAGGCGDANQAEPQKPVPISKPDSPALARFRGMPYYEYETGHGFIFYLSRSNGKPVRPGIVHSGDRIWEYTRVMISSVGNVNSTRGRWSQGIDLGSGRHHEVHDPMFGKYGMVMFKNARGAVVYAIRAPPVKGFDQGFIADVQIDDQTRVRYSYWIKTESDHEKVSDQVLAWFDSFLYPQAN